MNRIDRFNLYVTKYIIPLAYDESLSYYEQLIRISDKLNDVIIEFNGLVSYVEEFVKYVEKRLDEQDQVIEDFKEFINQQMTEFKEYVNQRLDKQDQDIEDFKELVTQQLDDFMARVNKALDDQDKKIDKLIVDTNTKLDAQDKKIDKLIVDTNTKLDAQDKKIDKLIVDTNTRLDAQDKIIADFKVEINKQMNSFILEVNAKITAQNKTISDFMSTVNTKLDGQNKTIEDFKIFVNTQISDQNKTIQEKFDEIKDYVDVELLKVGTITVTNVQEMINNQDITVNNYVRTLSYHSYRNSGGTLYRISVNVPQTGESSIELKNGLYAYPCENLNDVRTYGARGDGSDDTQAVADCVQNLSFSSTTNDVIVFPGVSSIYHIRNVSISYSIAGEGGTIKQIGQAFISFTGEYIKNMNFDMNIDLPSSATGIMIYRNEDKPNAPIIIENCSFINGHAFFIQTYADGLINIVNSHFENCRQGRCIELLNRSQFRELSKKVANCSFKNCSTGIYVKGYNNIITGNSFYDCYNAINCDSISPSSVNAGSTIISNNIIRKCSNNGIQALMTRNFIISNNIITLYVNAGIYAENCSDYSICDNILTQEDGLVATGIHCAKTVDATANNILIKGNTITSSKNGIKIIMPQTGIAYPSNVRVENNNIASVDLCISVPEHNISLMRITDNTMSSNHNNVIPGMAQIFSSAEYPVFFKNNLNYELIWDMGEERNLQFLIQDYIYDKTGLNSYRVITAPNDAFISLEGGKKNDIMYNVSGNKKTFAFLFAEDNELATELIEWI